jgi:translation initiation factor IF-2
MSKKLVQVVAELNISTKTIVEYLSEIGYNIDDKPSMLITDEMYEALLRKIKQYDSKDHYTNNIVRKKEIKN